MTSAFFNRMIFNAAAGGTADFVAASAVAGGRMPTTVPDETPVSYTAESADRLQWETGAGSWDTNTGSVRRTTVRENSIGTTAKINFTAAPIVRIGDCHAQDLVAILQGLVTTQFDKINDAALSDVPGLSLALLAGVRYRGRATLYTNMQATPGGMRVGIGFTGTVNAFHAHALPLIGGTTPANSGNVTVVGQITSGNSTFTIIEISFYIDVLTGGNLTVTWGQGTVAGPASSVQIGSNMMATAIG